MFTALAFIAFAVVVSAILIVFGRRTLSENEFEHLALNARAYAAAVGLYMSNARDELLVAADLVAPDVLRGAAADGDVRQALRTVLQRSRVFAFIYVAAPDGTILLLEPQDLEEHLYRRNVSFRRWFPEAVRMGALLVSNLFIDIPTNLPAVAVVKPLVGSDGRTAAVLVGSIRLDELSRTGTVAEGSHPSSGRYGYLTDGHGLVIAHQARPRFVTEQTDFSSEPTVRLALEGKQGTIGFFDPVEKEWMLGAYLPIRPSGSPRSRTWAVGYVVPQRLAFAPVASFSRTIGILAAVFAIGFGAFSFLFMRRLLHPLDELTAAVRTAGKGDFSVRVAHPRVDEFASLAAAYNEMARALQAQDRTIREHEDALRAANARLEESNRELEAFSYSVSHDLRAPLRSIDGFSHALMEDYGSSLSADARDYLNRIRNGVRRMGALIEDMLKLSRVSRAELTREPVNLSALAEREIKDLSLRDPGRTVEVVVAQGLMTTADPRLVQILLGNLLENAWKFTRSRPTARIEVGEAEDHGMPAWYVRDNGVGFDMKYAGKLFSAFQRLHSAEEYEGTGIGLVIVKRIAAKHGGRAWAESSAGGGATFYFTLSGEEVS